MKLKILGLVAGGALLALQSASAAAHTDVYVGLELGIPAPVVVERRPVYYSYYAPAPVYYYERYPRRHVYAPRHEVRYHERERRHDHGRHRGHHKHRR